MFDLIPPALLGGLLRLTIAGLVAFVFFFACIQFVLSLVAPQLDGFRWTKYSPNWRVLALLLAVAHVLQLLD